MISLLNSIENARSVRVPVTVRACASEQRAWPVCHLGKNGAENIIDNGSRVTLVSMALSISFSPPLCFLCLSKSLFFCLALPPLPGPPQSNVLIVT